MESDENPERSRGSYGRDDKTWSITYKDILEITCDKKSTIQWCQNVGLLSSSYDCPTCSQPMILVTSSSAKASSDIYVWRCKKMICGKRHQVERTIRKGSWFEHSNMTLEEVVELTYFWSRDFQQHQVRLHM